MSDDIVMRLRASSLAWRISLMPEAADEIDRLRSALDIAIRERNEARAEVKRLRAENARLRAQIVEYFREPGTHEVERLTRERDEARAEVKRLLADHGELRGAAREYLETLGGAMKSGKFEMGGTAEMAHFVRQALQKLDSLVFDRAGPRPAGLEKLHEPHGRAS